MDLKSNMPLEFFAACLDKFVLPELNSDYDEDESFFIHICSSETCVNLVGSFAEKLQLPPYFISGSSDYDMFLIINNENAQLNRIVENPNFQNDMKRWEDYPGYVSFTENIDQYVSKVNLQTTAQNILESMFPEKELFKVHKGSVDSGPAISIDKGHTLAMPYLEDTKFDFVPALKVNSWPQEVEKWITRDRQVNWPLRVLIDNIVSQGYHLVNKHPQGYWASAGNDDELVNYWRLSFSLAEIILARSLDTTQRQCVILMKMLKEKLTGYIITTYHVKTLAFWTFESIREKHLGKLFLLMIDKLINALATKRLAHYFLDSVNLFHGIPHGHLRTVLKQVIYYRNNPLDIFKGSLIGGLTSLSTSCMKERKGNLRKLANSNLTKSQDYKVFCYSRETEEIAETQDNASESDEHGSDLDLEDIDIPDDIYECLEEALFDHLKTQTKGDESMNQKSKENTSNDFQDTELCGKLYECLEEVLSNDLKTKKSMSCQTMDLESKGDDSNSDIDLFYQLVKENTANKLQQQSPDLHMDHHWEISFSPELVDYLEGVSAKPSDMEMLHQSTEDDVAFWVSHTLDSNDLRRTIFNTLYDVCSLDYSGMKIDCVIEGLLDGVQIFLEWALSQTITRHAVKEYLDENYMSRFLHKDTMCNKTNLRRHWERVLLVK